MRGPNRKLDDVYDPVRHTTPLHSAPVLSVGEGREGGSKGGTKQCGVAVLLNFLLHDAFRPSVRSAQGTRQVKFEVRAGLKRARGAGQREQGRQAGGRQKGGRPARAQP